MFTSRRYFFFTGVALVILAMLNFSIFVGAPPNALSNTILMNGSGTPTTANSLIDGTTPGIFIEYVLSLGLFVTGVGFLGGRNWELMALLLLLPDIAVKLVRLPQFTTDLHTALTLSLVGVEVLLVVLLQRFRLRRNPNNRSPEG